MLSNKDRRIILQEIARGVSVIDIHRRYGYSRHTIYELIRKTKKVGGCGNRLAVCFSYLLTVETGKEGRCPTCGKKVNLPCRDCLMAQYKKVEPDGFMTDEFEELLNIQNDLNRLELPDEDEDEDAQEEEDATIQD